MDVRQMHIQVEQSTQQVAANRSRGFYPEEIDLALNKIQTRVVAACLRPKQDGSGGFELDQVKADMIRGLIKQTSLRAYINDARTYKAFLPPDYRYLLSDWSYTTNRCTTAADTVSTEVQYITRLPQTRSGRSTPPFYASFNLQLPGAALVLPADATIGHTYTGLPEKEDILLIIPYILDKLGAVYWEKFDNLRYPGNYIAVTNTSPGAVTMTIDGTEVSTEIITTRSLSYHPSSTAKPRANRLSPSDIIPNLNQTAHWKTAHYSPITELQGENLIIHRDDSFTVSEVGITYVRKPRPINLSLNSDCELSGEDTHLAICDLASEYLLGTMQNQEGTALKMADIDRRVTL